MKTNWDEEQAKGAIPPPPVGDPRQTVSVVVTYDEAVKEYRRVKNVNVQPGMVVLFLEDREVLLPVTSAVRDIEIVKEAILT
jgi:hypothetical protein